MLDEDFAEAFLHRRRPHLLCGLRLLPFSRWHAANLDFVRSPLIGEHGILTRAAADFLFLWQAALCCRLRFPSRIDLTHHPLRRRLAAWRFLRDPMRGHRELRDYFADYASRPEFVTSENAQAVRSPWYLYEVAALLRYDRELTKAEAWDMPLGEGTWWLTALQEASGAKVDLITPEDREQLAELGITEEV